MTFKKYVCWSSENVEPILNIEAIQPADSIFLATHHPIVMKRGQLISGEAETIYSEREFLKDFLAPNDFAFVPVLGGSGTGKSHLIRWLSANIESTEKCKVLLIPKLGTNLRDIIGRILNLPELKGDKFDEYRYRLNQASVSLTEGKAREQLLNQLAIAIGDNERRERSQITEIQEYLISELSSLLYDPFFRQYWLKDKGVIHRLVTHILGSEKTIEIVEERRGFTLADIPTDVLDINKAGEQSREFYSALVGDDSIQKETVAWLNLHLDEAIAKVLNLGREDLQILMREIRQALAKQEIELILLIEDFAKLQGIDRELLEAVLARPQQSGSEPLCAIRTALACTSGYFESLIETVRQRVTFSVNLDVGRIDERALVTQSDLQQFVARYLNSIRHGSGAVASWYEEYRASPASKGELPSFCDSCQYLPSCHAGFGAVDGIGLYPFTSLALKQMSNRTNSDNFNPRILLKDVLKYALENSSADIPQGRFPSVVLREHFGKMRLSAIAQDDIKNRDSANADRRQTLIDLWTDSDKLCDLPIEIHTAFDLPPLGDGVSVIEPGETGGTKSLPPPETTVIIPEKLVKQLDILNNWNNQGIIPQDLEKDLRELIYPAVTERIEWDSEILLRGAFAGNDRPFKQRNVIFHSPRVTRGTYAGIILSLPLNPEDPNEFRETAIAFQGILQYSHYKHWNFENGDRYFRAYAKQLDRWSEYILDCIRRRPALSQEAWNPVPAAVELLAIAARMSGHQTGSTEDLVNALFLEIEDKDEANRSKSWRELFKVFQKNREKLLEIVKSRIACTKGGSPKFQILDAVQIIQPLKEIRKNWKVESDIPDVLSDEYQVIKTVRQKVDELLIPALEEERDRQLRVYQSLKAEFGEDVKKKEVLDTVRQAIDKAKEAGVSGKVNTDNLLQVVEQFQRTRFGGYMEAMKKVEAESNPSDTPVTKLLQHFGENYQKAMNDASQFLAETQDFLNKSAVRAREQIAELQSLEGGSIEVLLQSIQGRIDELQSLLQEIKE